MCSANNKENKYFKAGEPATLKKTNQDSAYRSVVKLDENYSFHEEYPQIQQYSNKKCINVRVPIKMIDVSGDIKPR